MIEDLNNEAGDGLEDLVALPKLAVEIGIERQEIHNLVYKMDWKTRKGKWGGRSATILDREQADAVRKHFAAKDKPKSHRYLLSVQAPRSEWAHIRELVEDMDRVECASTQFGSLDVCIEGEWPSQEAAISDRNKLMSRLPGMTAWQEVDLLELIGEGAHHRRWITPAPKISARVFLRLSGSPHFSTMRSSIEQTIEELMENINPLQEAMDHFSIHETRGSWSAVLNLYHLPSLEYLGSTIAAIVDDNPAITETATFIVQQRQFWSKEETYDVLEDPISAQTIAGKHGGTDTNEIKAFIFLRAMNGAFDQLATELPKNSISSDRPMESERVLEVLGGFQFVSFISTANSVRLEDILDQKYRELQIAYSRTAVVIPSIDAVSIPDLPLAFFLIRAPNIIQSKLVNRISTSSDLAILLKDQPLAVFATFGHIDAVAVLPDVLNSSAEKEARVHRIDPTPLIGEVAALLMKLPGVKRADPLVVNPHRFER